MNTAGAIDALVSSPAHSSADPFDVPSAADVVVVLCDMKSQEPAKHFVRSLHAQQRPMPPVLVMLLRDGLGCRSVLEAQEAFLSLNVDDVLVRQFCGDTPEQLTLAVELSLQKAAAHQLTIQSYEEQIEQQCTVIAQNQQNSLMFWNCVHHVFPGFPPMSPSHDRNIAPGAQVPGYKLVDYICGGHYGQVFIAAHRETGRLDAVKVLPKRELNTVGRVQTVWTEFKLLGTLKHKHIVELRGVSHGLHHVYIAMELMGPINLCQALQAAGGKLAVPQAKRFAAQIANAVAYLHQTGVAHRDLKPENVAVSKDGETVKLLDFGCATQLGKDQQGACGTVPFMAPEVMCGGGYDPALADLFACGMLILEMLCGEGTVTKALGWQSNVAASAARATQLKEFLERGKLWDIVEVAIGGSVSKDLDELFSRTLAASPAQRWAAAELEGCAWISGPGSGRTRGVAG